MTSIEPISFIPVIFEKKNMTKRGTSYAVYLPKDFYRGVLQTLKDTELIAVVFGGKMVVYIPAKLAGGTKEEILFDVVFTALEGLFSITEDEALKEAVKRAYHVLVTVEKKESFIEIEDILEDFRRGKEVKKK